MNKKLLSAVVASSIFSCSFASADVHARGADGPAAIAFFASVLANNIDTDGIDCAGDPSDIAQEIISDSKNKKLIKEAINKNVKNFLKHIGVNIGITAFFLQASQEAVDLVCSGEDDGGDPELPE